MNKQEMKALLKEQFVSAMANEKQTVEAKRIWVNNGMLDELPLVTFICPKCGERHYAYQRSNGTLNYNLSEMNVFNYRNNNECDLSEYEIKC